MGVLHGQKGLQPQTDIQPGQIIKSYNKGKNAKCAPSNNGNDLNYEKEEPSLALFAIACPFGPPSLFELPQRDSIFKTKHKINLAPISIDTK